MGLNNFENDIVNRLKILVDNKVILYYPFFANTFPLAYFYSLALERQKKGVNGYIVEHDWNDKSLNNEEVIPNGNLALIFDTQFRIEHFRLGYRRRKIDFVKYYPRFIFCDYSSQIIKFLEDNSIQNEQFKRDFYQQDFDVSIPKFLEVIDKGLLDVLGLEEIEIYTDTEKEAEHIKSKIQALKIESKITVFLKGKGIYPNVYSSDKKNVFKLYFYSAPYNIYFLQNPFKYLAFKFSKDEISDEFSTFNILLFKEENINNPVIDKIEQAIEYFHSSIFSEAEHNPENLNSVFRSYNYISKAKEPFDIFDNVYSYAQCLRLHNMEEPKNSPSDNIWDGLLFNRRLGQYDEHITKYFKQTVRDIYTLLSLDYLKNRYGGVQNINTRNFSTISDLFYDKSFTEGTHHYLLIDFIICQAVNFILIFKDIDNNPIYKALNRGISEGSLLEYLVYHIEGIFRDELNQCQPNNLLIVKDQYFNLDRELDFLIMQLKNSQEIEFANVDSLLMSLMKISSIKDDLFDHFKSNLDFLRKSDDFFKMNFDAPEVIDVLEKRHEKARL